MLPLFALLVFALLGIGAVTVDLGFALWSQQLMQDAADSSSLAGARDLRGATPEDTARATAQGWVSYTFDDDTDLTSNPRNVGAGPAISLSGGTGGELQANQGMTVVDGGTGLGLVFRPSLELNTSNEAHGDLVVGKFLDTWPATESAAYVRNDFQVAPYTDQARSLLVRLRRTNNFPVGGGGGLDSVAGVSSKGAPLPFLYGRGALILRDPSVDYSPREHGISVRATAIGQGRPVLAVGVMQLAAGIPGVLPVAFDQVYWSSLGGNLSDVSVPGTTLTLNFGANTLSNPAPVGYTVEPLRSVGDEVYLETLDPAYRNVLLEGYFPLYDDVASDTGAPPTATLRVVGYGYGTIFVGPGGSVDLVRRGAGFHGRNSSSVPIRPPALNSIEWAEVLRLNREIVAAALAPALVR